MTQVFAEIGILLTKIFAGLYIFCVLLRFWFQVLKVNFYNPFAQFLVNLTNPALIPLRRIIPGLGGLDWAALVLLVGLQALKTSLLGALYTGQLLPFSLLGIWTFVGLFALTLDIFFWALVIQIIVSWLTLFGVVSTYRPNPLLGLLADFTEPLFDQVRRWVPTGAGGIDFSPIFIFVGLQIGYIVLAHLPSPHWGY